MAFYLSELCGGTDHIAASCRAANWGGNLMRILKKKAKKEKEPNSLGRQGMKNTRKTKTRTRWQARRVNKSNDLTSTKLDKDCVSVQRRQACNLANLSYHQNSCQSLLSLHLIVVFSVYTYVLSISFCQKKQNNPAAAVGKALWNIWNRPKMCTHFQVVFDGASMICHLGQTLCRVMTSATSSDILYNNSWTETQRKTI